MDLQVRWHDFLRSVASSVERQSYEYAQITDDEALSSPMGCAWSLLVSVVHCEASRETQFSMLHDIANVVYKGQQSMLLKNMVIVTDTQQGIADKSIKT